MFTGIVEGRGTVAAVEQRGDLLRLTVDLPNAAHLERGASVSIDGACLTAVDINDAMVGFDVIPETLNRTTLGALEVGALVNVERALRFGDEVGGHLVSGHVFATGTLTVVEELDGGRNLFVSTSNDVMPYVLEKGYIAVAGISLTVGRCEKDGFWLHLIPETLERTTLGEARTGDLVNLEVDPITVAAVDTVHRLLAQKGASQ